MPGKPKQSSPQAARKQGAVTTPSDAVRATALEAVLNHAPDIGVEAALKKFGASLAKVEKDLIRLLSAEELTHLRNIKRKLGIFHGPGPNFI